MIRGGGLNLHPSSSICSGGSGDSERIEAPSGDPLIPTGMSWIFTGGTETVGPREISILAIAGERFESEGEKLDRGGE